MPELLRGTQKFFQGLKMYDPIYQKQYREKHKEERKKYMKYYKKGYYQKNKEKIKQKSKDYYYKNRPNILIYHKNISGHKRMKLVNLLGAFCKKCGETRFALLQLDHINNDGEEDRNIFHTPSNMVSYYLKNPELAKKKLQPLCANCNWLKRQQNMGYELMKDCL
ncbi:MAG: hypothetical protein ACE5H1_07025 [Thermodesulfobacteriota bacterium]